MTGAIDNEGVAAGQGREWGVGDFNSIQLLNSDDERSDGKLYLWESVVGIDDHGAVSKCSYSLITYTYIGNGTINGSINFVELG